jgi:hypothetical protein
MLGHFMASLFLLERFYNIFLMAISLFTSLIALVSLLSQLNEILLNKSVLVEANLQESREFMNGKVLRVAVIHVN